MKFSIKLQKSVRQNKPLENLTPPKSIADIQLEKRH